MSNIIRVNRPTLSSDELAQRMEQIKQAAARLIEATESKKKEET